MARTPDGATARDTSVVVRMTTNMRNDMDSQRSFRGGMSRSTYIRWLISQDSRRIEHERGDSQ